MFSLQALTNPSPSDANLRTNADRLGMLREGPHDLDRFFFYGGPSRILSNGLNDPFDHSYSVGGYDANTRRIDGTVSAIGKSGIIPFPPEAQRQFIGDEVSNNPVPVRSALVDNPVTPGKFLDDRRVTAFY